MSGHVPEGAAGFAQARDSILYSVITHAIAAIVLLWVVTNAPKVVAPNEAADLRNVVWSAEPGVGGGGGGGGNDMAEPPRKTEHNGREKSDVPAAAQPTPVAEETPPLTQVIIPAVPSASALRDSVGIITNAPSVQLLSQGSGTDGGAGTGGGKGNGPGDGPGLGDGRDGGTGGGPLDGGVNGVSMPEVIYEKKPEYTSAAMNAKVQGTVEVEAVVNPDGTVGAARVVRSLDNRFGLDEKAIEAVRQWRFRPALRFGRPVAVRVVIELTFTLR